MDENTLNTDIKTFRILCATGIGNMDSDISKLPDVEIVGTCDNKENLGPKIDDCDPDIVIITDNLYGNGSVIDLLIKLKRDYPEVRFIYFIGDINKRREKDRMNALGALVLSGIYDIVSGTVNPNIINDIIRFPMDVHAASEYSAGLIDTRYETKAAAVSFTYQGYEDIKQEKDNRNCIVCTYSAKPGTGKTFLAVNMAIAIANYGVDSPKVALIEADLQTLSLGTVLGMTDDKEYNLYTCIKAIKEMVANPKMEEEDLYHHEKIIKKCFLKFKPANNMYVLYGSSITEKDIGELDVDGADYNMLLDFAAENFDVVIVDLNSDVKEAPTYITWVKSKQKIFIMNLDYNNVMNNSRQCSLLKDVQSENDIKYVLNMDVENTPEYNSFGVGEEELTFTAETIEKHYFKLSSRIPYIPFSIAMNANSSGTPIMLNDRKETLAARVAIMDIANDIWPLDDNYYKAKKKMTPEKKKGFFSHIFGK